MKESATANSGLPQYSIGVMPDDYGVEKSEKWYVDRAKWVITNYNHWIPRYSAGSFNTSRNRDNDRWATNASKWISYTKGTQDNSLLGHVARDVKNRTIDIPIIPDMNIFQICKHHEGKLAQTYSQKLDERIGASDRTADFLDERLKKIELAKMAIDMKKAMPEMKDYGVSIQPMEGVDFESQEQLDKYLEEAPMEQIERIFTNAGISFLWNNNWKEQFDEMYKNLVRLGYNRCYVYAENGEVKMRNFRPDLCIWDNWANNGAENFSTKDRFQGVLIPYTIPELFGKYNFTDDEKQELQNIARFPTDASVLPSWFVSSNISIGNGDLFWWNLNARIPIVWVAQTYFKSLKNDNKTETWYRCDLIGNRYSKNMDEANNIVEDKFNPSDVEPIFLDCHPDMYYGSNQGFPELLHRLSDEVSALEHKNTFFIARALGKVIFVNRSLLDENTSVREVMTNLKSAGIETYEGVNIDSARAEFPGRDIVDVVDLTVDGQGIVANRSEINEKKRQMGLIASTPEAIMGQQTLQGSNQELQTTLMNASYGIMPFYGSVEIYITKIVQRAVDLQKMVYSQVEAVKTLQISERDYQLVKFLKPWSLKKLHVFVDTNDGLTPQEKQQYYDIIFNYSQNPESGLSPQDAFEVMGMSSKREINNYIAYKKRTHDRLKEMQRQQDMALQVENQQAMIQGQEKNTAIQAQAGIEKEGMKTERDIMLKQMEQ